MSNQSFLDAIDGLDLVPTGNVSLVHEAPMGVRMECDLNIKFSPSMPYVSEYEIMVRIGSKFCIDTSAMRPGEIARVVGQAKRSIKHFAFSDSLDFVSRVIEIATKTNNRELLMISLGFQDRIFRAS